MQIENPENKRNIAMDNLHTLLNDSIFTSVKSNLIISGFSNSFTIFLFLRNEGITALELERLLGYIKSNAHLYYVEVKQHQIAFSCFVD